jgi:hypothetical protein
VACWVWPVGSLDPEFRAGYLSGIGTYLSQSIPVQASSWNIATWLILHPLQSSRTAAYGCVRPRTTLRMYKRWQKLYCVVRPGNCDHRYVRGTQTLGSGAQSLSHRVEYCARRVSDEHNTSRNQQGIKRSTDPTIVPRTQWRSDVQSRLNVGIQLNASSGGATALKCASRERSVWVI